MVQTQSYLLKADRKDLVCRMHTQAFAAQEADVVGLDRDGEHLQVRVRKSSIPILLLWLEVHLFKIVQAWRQQVFRDMTVDHGWVQ